LENKSIKSQLRKADKFGATKVLIRGDQELINNKIIEKNLDKGSQQEFDLNEWIGILGEKNASI
ncbi:MAG: His/Gly/Thr/Pro-type tRNA ligase C-terminal domain-containing protein, partial [Verrucomicrobiota bacterium]|nr:His/Gly/Thr/Pro-type tRNA ligase C-terminal domain-containing protein [Verrucomicrobiota bacterium]